MTFRYSYSINGNTVLVNSDINKSVTQNSVSSVIMTLVIVYVFMHALLFINVHVIQSDIVHAYEPTQISLPNLEYQYI